MVLIFVSYTALSLPITAEASEATATEELIHALSNKQLLLFIDRCVASSCGRIFCCHTMPQHNTS